MAHGQWRSSIDAWRKCVVRRGERAPRKRAACWPRRGLGGREGSGLRPACRACDIGGALRGDRLGVGPLPLKPGRVLLNRPQGMRVLAHASGR